MAKGNVILKISGILLFILSIIGILWSMYYGFTGAMGFSKMEKSCHYRTADLFWAFWNPDRIFSARCCIDCISPF